METIRALPDVGTELRRKQCTRPHCGYSMVTQEVIAPERLFRRLDAMLAKRRRAAMLPKPRRRTAGRGESPRRPYFTL